ncbi:hypothetical protein NQ317_016337 [Molorchus minor]|uniref:ZP domain-containing protein n=1 Tax=Molorchus minor TaxID=1323400 RepID=A0ABQ9J3E7_9CUCU|nr:hypothetical protein NQ317_016337 [Molorchus minor]
MPETNLMKFEKKYILEDKPTFTGIGWRAIECVAHDGLGDSSQKLLDQEGCPVDELLMPKFIYGPTRPIALMRHQEAVSRFAAFKFPDRDRLHLSCGLQLCRGLCPKVINDENNHFFVALQKKEQYYAKCKEYQTENRTGRIFSKVAENEVLERLEVFNSIEVLASEIDNLKQASGDRTFCISPDKMAIAFCILGLIFLVAVFIAAVCLIRAKRHGHNIPYYSRSLFSSSSEGSAFGSKLLLNDSPSLGEPALTPRRMQYGRIL